ncbi:GNAT family N-acetyltransferase [Nocardia altamirensis]|uniref:GNAT family N-acetyltransferase n=1 Tax=Nocardia TaxID=1817 RepID=UPI00084064EC|nr:GNAT family N-acetyltransferase [Nocardia altamirensis]
MSDQLRIRPATAADYDAIANVVDAWWQRPVTAAVPRLFLDHFAGTSLIAERDSRLIGFLVGFLSPHEPNTAYIHFVGVNPRHRGKGLARDLYDRFITLARAADRQVVKAITSPGNQGSVAFHRALGFTVVGPVRDYNGPGRDMMTFELSLSS